jgi:hypothetical protein
MLNLNIIPDHAKKRFTEKQEKKWDEMYAELCSFHDKHGHCIVKNHDESNAALANWVSLQRLNYRQGLMDETRQQRSGELYMEYSTKEATSRRWGRQVR